MGGNTAAPERVVGCLGLVSLILTLMNIVAILLFGWLVLKLKEVTPERVPQPFSYFWKRDVRNYRKFGNTQEDISQIIADESKEVLGIDGSENYSLAETFIQTIFDKIEQDFDYCRIKDLQKSQIRINSTNLAYSSKVNSTINLKQDVARLSSLPGNVRRSSMSNLQYQNSKQYVRTSVWPNLDTKLLHQAELMVKSSLEKLSYSQHPSEVIDRSCNQTNETEQSETA